MTAPRGLGKLLLVVVVASNAAAALANLVVYGTTAGDIGTLEENRGFRSDAILVLGASVFADGTPTSILADRLDVGAEAYFAGVAPKIIVSGDNGDGSNNETTAMKAYLVERGVPSEDVFCDQAGFNTYDSMWRARNVFGVGAIAVVTQTYHEYRAVFNAKGVGMVARGISSDLRAYKNQVFYDLREILARTKDLGQVLLQLPARTQGEPISLGQSGDVTD